MTCKLICRNPVSLSQLYTGRVQNDIKLRITPTGSVGNEVKLYLIQAISPSYFTLVTVQSHLSLLPPLSRYMTEQTLWLSTARMRTNRHVYKLLMIIQHLWSFADVPLRLSYVTFKPENRI